MIEVSDKMFDTIMARANELGEEAFRRFLFDHPGMPAEAVELIRDRIILLVAEDYVERLAKRANAFATRRGEGER